MSTLERMVEIGERAIEVKQLRARLRADLRDGTAAAGRAKLAEIIEANPDWLGAVMVWQILMWMPRATNAEAQHHIAEADIRDLYRLFGALTERQRALIVESLRAKAVA